jgi:hypothetical protein
MRDPKATVQLEGLGFLFFIVTFVSLAIPSLQLRPATKKKL